MEGSYDYQEAAIRALVRVDSLAIDSTVDVMPVVRGRVARLVNRPWRYRYGVSFGMAILVAITVGGVTALAVGSASGVIQIQWQRVPLLGLAKPLSASVQNREVTSLAGAQVRVGFPVEVFSGIDAHLDRVEYQPPLMIEVNGQVAPHNTGAAVLYYTFGTTRLQVVEQLDSAGSGPLHVVLKAPPPSARDASTIRVEAIAGSDRVVTRSSSGQIVAVEWKNLGNVIVRINVESPVGIDSSTAASLILHLG